MLSLVIIGVIIPSITNVDAYGALYKDSQLGIKLEYSSLWGGEGRIVTLPCSGSYAVCTVGFARFFSSEVLSISSASMCGIIFFLSSWCRLSSFRNSLLSQTSLALCSMRFSAKPLINSLYLSSPRNLLRREVPSRILLVKWTVMMI